MKKVVIILLSATVIISCTKKYYLTSIGGERPLSKYQHMLNISCTDIKTIIDTSFYYRQYSINEPIYEPQYRYLRFLDNCRIMENINWSRDPAHYSLLENIDGELIGKYSVNISTREIVTKVFSQNKWGIIITGYGTVSKTGDTIRIDKLHIPHVYSNSRYYLIKTNIPVKNKINGEW